MKGLGILLWVFFALVGAVGWVMNIFRVISLASDAAQVSTMFVLRCVGIVVAPLGAILGWVS